MVAKRKIISLFDWTGEMVVPWLAAGYECWIIDGQHEPGIHRDPVNPLLVRVGMWFHHDQLDAHAMAIALAVGEGVEAVFSFAECTDLTTTGARWWPKKAKEDPLFQEKAIAMCRLVEQVAEDCGGVPWMLENPAVSRINTMWRRPDFTFHPHEFSEYLPEEEPHPLYPDIYPPADRYKKLTGLWHGNGFMVPEKRPRSALSNDNPGWAKLGGKSKRTKNIRSVTPRSLALAVFGANHKGSQNDY